MSDIDTAVVDSLKALAPKRPIREAAVLYVDRQLIMDRVAASRLPAIYQWPENAKEGGFAAYGPRILSIIPEFTVRQLVVCFFAASDDQIHKDLTNIRASLESAGLRTYLPAVEIALSR